MADASGIRWGKAFVEIGADISPLTKALDSARADIAKIGSNLRDAGRSLMTVGLAMSAPLALGLTQFATYEAALSGLKAAANPTAAEFDRLKRKIEEVAVATGTAPAEVATGFGELLKAGLSVNQVIGGVGETMIKFGRVAGMEVNDTVRILVQSMQIFSREGLNASQVSNIMVAAADASTGSLRDIAEGFGVVGGVAAGFGMNMRDVATAIAVVMDFGGVTGSEAATQLKMFLMDLAKGSGEAGDAIQELGLVFRGANGQMLPFDSILKNLDKSLAGKGIAERERLLMMLGGAKGSRGIMALLTGGEAGWTSQRDRESKSNTLETKFAVMTDNILGHAKRLWVQLQLVFIEIGAAVAPALRVIGSLFQMILPSILDWIKANSVLVGIIASLGVGLIVTGAALWIAGVAFGVIATGLGVVSGLLGFAAGGFGLLAVATWAWNIAAAVAGIGFGLLKTGLLLLAGGFGLATIGAIALKVAVWAVAAAKTVLGVIMAGLSMGLMLLAGGVGASMVATKLWTVVTTLASAATAIWTASINLLAGALAIVFALPIIGFFGSILSAVWSTGALGRAWEGVSESVGTALDKSWQATKETFTKISATALEAFGGLKAAFKAGDMGAGWEIFKIAGQIALIDLKDLGLTMWDAWKLALTDIFYSVADVFEESMHAAWDAVKLRFSRESQIFGWRSAATGEVMAGEDTRAASLDARRERRVARQRRDEERRLAATGAATTPMTEWEAQMDYMDRMATGALTERELLELQLSDMVSGIQGVADSIDLDQYQMLGIGQPAAFGSGVGNGLAGSPDMPSTGAFGSFIGTAIAGYAGGNYAQRTADAAERSEAFLDRIADRLDEAGPLVFE